MRGKWILAGVVVLAAGAASALFIAKRAPRASAAREASVPAASPAPAELVLPATIRAQHVVPVAAPVEGTLDAVAADVGEQVYEGQVLARVDNSTLATDENTAASELETAQSRLTELQDLMIAARLEASRARADAARAQADFDRSEKTFLRQQMLQREGATPRLVYEKSERDYTAARSVRDNADGIARTAEDRLSSLVKRLDASRVIVEDKQHGLDEARQRIAEAEIRAPVGGLVVGRTRRPGEEVSPLVKDLFQIAIDTTALEAVITPDPATLARLRPGQDASISAAGAPDIIPAKIDEIRGAEIILRFMAPSPDVRPGLTAHVRMKTP